MDRVAPEARWATCWEPDCLLSLSPALRSITPTIPTIEPDRVAPEARWATCWEPDCLPSLSPALRSITPPEARWATCWEPACPPSINQGSLTLEGIAEEWEVLGYAAADVTAAVTAAAIVAPFVAAVDKAIAESAGGAVNVWTSLGKSIRAMMSSPLTYLRQPAFRYLWVMYGGTYCAANTFTSFEETSKTSKPLTKTLSIFCVNASLSLWKDSNFAKLFGTGPPRAIPPPAYVSWFARDFISMGVIFTLPPLVAKQLHERAGMDQQKATTVCQLGLPLLLQPFVAPLHLYGYVAYNNPAATAASQRSVMRREIWGAVQMRLIRCVPPYCAGTVVNSTIRRALKPSSN